MGSVFDGRQGQLRFDAGDAIQLCGIADVSGDATRRQLRQRVGRRLAGSDASVDTAVSGRRKALSGQRSSVIARACRGLPSRVVIISGRGWELGGEDIAFR